MSTLSRKRLRDSDPASLHDEATDTGVQPGLAAKKRRTLTRVYLLDLWSFIPYYMARLYEGLRQQGVDAKLCSARYHLDRNYFREVGIHPEGVLLDFGGAVKDVFFRRLIKSAEYIINLCYLSLRLIRAKSTILHVEYFPFLDHGYRFELWFLKWVKYLNIPIVYTVHNVTYQDAPDRHKPLYSRAYRMADAVICHGSDAREQLIRNLGVRPERIRVIPHGPLFETLPDMTPQAARVQLGRPAEESLVLCLGVISEYKGIPFLLDAWKRLATSGQKGRLLIAGTGDASLLASIRETVSTEGLSSSVELRLSYIPMEQLPLLYMAADILVYPYKAGTTSGALLTGMNYGKAIIATKLPFFCEYLKNGQNALLVDYGDVTALESALRLLLQSPEERVRIAGAPGKKPRDSSWLAIAGSTRECYEHVGNSCKMDNEEANTFC